MGTTDDLICLFSVQVEQRDGSYLIEVPERELQQGTIREGEVYRVAILSGMTDETTEQTAPQREGGPPTPPVTEGEQRTVEIETIGDQGDGIARVKRGFVVIVPETEQGERVRIEVTDVQQNVAFAHVVERLSY